MSKILEETHYTLEFSRCAYLHIVVQIDTLRGDVGANEDVHLWTRKLVGLRRTEFGIAMRKQGLRSWTVAEIGTCLA